MFRKSSSRNQHDSNVVSADRAGARHQVNNDVAKRCNEVMRFMRKECAGFRKAGLRHHVQASLTKTAVIVNYMKGVDPSYRRSDIIYTLRKLDAEGFLGKDGAYYYLQHDPREVSIVFR